MKLYYKTKQQAVKAGKLELKKLGHSWELINDAGDTFGYRIGFKHKPSSMEIWMIGNRKFIAFPASPYFGMIRCIATTPRAAFNKFRKLLQTFIALSISIDKVEILPK